MLQRGFDAVATGPGSGDRRSVPSHTSFRSLLRKRSESAVGAQSAAASGSALLCFFGKQAIDEITWFRYRDPLFSLQF
jgi:hypothetical protein